MCTNSKRQLTDAQLQHAIKRNFGGFDDINTYEIFKNHLKGLEHSPDLKQIEDIKVNMYMYGN